jgi:hypothetical protein
MRKILLIVFIVLCNNSLHAQEVKPQKIYLQDECFTLPDDNAVGREVNDINYVSLPDVPIKVIRVNFHYLLRTDGTGNFTETGDNYTNRPYNGYMYAEDMVKKCNRHWNENVPLRHMPDPPVPALPKKIQLQLCGVFFHRNTTDYEQYSCDIAWPTFKENSGEVINIYITKLSTGGCAGYCDDEQMLIGTAYKNYITSVDSNNTWYNTPDLYNHELGHLFGLDHAIQNCCINKDCNNCDDRITDTPNFFELIHLHYLPCEWNHLLGSNNLMDYCADQIALSPMQIARMHACIDGGKLYYRNCKYRTQSLNITNFTTNKAYIARYVTIPSKSNIVVGNNSALFINAEEVTIDGPFEVQSGSILNIETVPSCN